MGKLGKRIALGLLFLMTLGAGPCESPDEQPEDAGEPRCDAGAIPCCDNETGGWVQKAECTHQGRQCPEGTSKGTCWPSDVGMDGGNEEMKDVEYSCDALLVRCCDEESGEYVQKADCTANGLQCPMGLTSEDCGPDAGTGGGGG